MVSFLYIEITLAILPTNAKIPVLKDIFIINESGTDSPFLNCFKRKVGTMLRFTALLLVLLLIIFCISFSFTWSRNKECLGFYF